MAVKKKGLGRGLTALLGNSDVESMIEPASADELRHIDVDLIERVPGSHVSILMKKRCKSWQIRFRLKVSCSR